MLIVFGAATEAVEGGGAAACAQESGAAAGTGAAVGTAGWVESEATSCTAVSPLFVAAAGVAAAAEAAGIATGLVEFEGAGVGAGAAVF